MIKVTLQNYKSYMPIDIVAFSFASAGAMGCPGEMIILDRKGEKYVLNYCYEPWEDEQLFEICPKLEECDMYLLGEDDAPEGWMPINLGMGNHLFVQNEIGEVLMKQIDGLFPGEVYQIWEDAVKEIINSSKA